MSITLPVFENTPTLVLHILLLGGNALAQVARTTVSFPHDDLTDSRLGDVARVTAVVGVLRDTGFSTAWHNSRYEKLNPPLWPLPLT